MKQAIRNWRVVPTEKGINQLRQSVGFLSFRSAETGVPQWEFPTIVLPMSGCRVSILYR